ncbi:hypothetical protein V8C26DRAFT_334831 [Trichoderma gracile]
MAFRGLFGEAIESSGDLVRHTRPGLLEELAGQAEGLFLWAQLPVNLLESPSLSPNNRFQILTVPGYIDGLDGLYERTLEVLRRKLVNEQRIAQTLFRWMCCSLMPLTLRELDVVLAINPGKPTSTLDYLPDYPKCIPIITGALVEHIPSQNTLSFIHITFKDFLLSPPNSVNRRHQRLLAPDDQDHPESVAFRPRRWLRHRSADADAQVNHSDHPPGPLSTRPPEHRYSPHPEDEIELKVSNLSDVHFSMAQTCLSYLVFDVPSKPLTKEDATPSRWDLEASSNTILATHEDELRLRTKSEEKQLRRSYPLLPYSALCWDYHVAHAHELRGLGTVAPFPLERPPLWYTLLSQFLLDRLSVTAWVEASYAFKVPPRLSRLPPALVYLRPQPTDMVMTVQTREYQ